MMSWKTRWHLILRVLLLLLLSSLVIYFLFYIFNLNFNQYIKVSSEIYSSSDENFVENLQPVKFLPSEPLQIFMYHDIKTDEEMLSGLAVSVSKFRNDLTWLREHGYTTILPSDLVSAESLPNKPVMITFDDGYLSSYLVLYPILQEFQAKALISPIVITAEAATENFCNWAMYREMEASGLVEVGSHSYDLHNPWSKGEFIQGEPNGVQRRPEETEIDFQFRVLNDIQKSYERITEELGHPPVCFAYPFGADEPDTWALVDSLFSVSLLTLNGPADLSKGMSRLPRWTVTEETPIFAFLKESKE